MKDFFKKEKPLQGISGWGGGATGLRMSSASSKTYVDDVFSTYVYTGTGSSGHVISNSINLASKGGMTWIKKRSGNDRNTITDTVRGVTKQVFTERTDGEDTVTSRVTTFSSDGFTLGNNGRVNGSGDTYASWTFRKAPGFFDVVTWTGNATGGRQITHNLGCQPGRIIIKCTSKSGDWLVNDYSVDQNGNLWGKLNEDGQFLGAGQYSGSTGPTSTHFTLGSANEVNENGETFVAYVFAGADRTGNASVEFQGEDGYLKFKDSSDWEFSGQFCIEYWIYATYNNAEFPTVTWGSGAYRAVFWTNSTWKMEWPDGNSNITLGGSAATNTWKHHVITRDSSNVVRFFIDGELISNATVSANMGASEQLFLGYKANVPSSGLKNGKLSNVRIVNGSIPTTYQTSSTTNSASIFTSPTSPLSTSSQGATASDVKLLCCNDIGASQYTYINDSPGITNYGEYGALGSKESPFSATTDASAVFGADGDLPIVRMGSYMGSGSSTAGNTVDVGFEPSYIMIKRSGETANWAVFDSMRGIVSEGDDPVLQPDLNSSEYTTSQYLDITPRGFRLKATFNQSNANENGYLYIAIRRPDGYVGKPAEVGTDVFAIDGSGSGTDPAFDSGFPVDFGMLRDPSTTETWYTGRRLTGKYILYADTTAVESASTLAFDYNDGWQSSSGASYHSWMWKRHKGFDVVTWTGDGASSRTIPHSLSQSPEMIWIKNRSNIADWTVGHIGTNGGTNPWNYYLNLNTTDGQATYALFNNTAPTSTVFSIGTADNNVNTNNYNYTAMLFSSVAGISKVGYYTGTGGTQTITTGFAPRFVLIKSTSNSSTDWVVLDTTRGWASGDDKEIYLNSNAAQVTNNDHGAPTSTGFTLGQVGNTNANEYKYIYYAHA